MQTQKPMQRLARRIRTLVGCVALCGLAVVSITAALPGGVASSASAYADDSIPAQTAKAVERHVIVSDGNFETLRDAIGQALPSVTTVVELSGDYEAPTSFDKSYITIPDKRMSESVCRTEAMPRCVARKAAFLHIRCSP